jgi:hypothetical protein
MTSDEASVRIVPREVVYESVFSGSVGLAQLTTADSRVV